MPILYVMCGISGSGKSTWAREFKEQNSNKIIIISTDKIREMIYGDEAIQGDGELVFKIAYKSIEAGLELGYDVIFDTTNYKVRDRKKIISIFSHMANLYCVYISIDLDTAIERQKFRERKVPDSVIINQFNKLVIPSKEEGWGEIIYYKKEEN